MLKKKFNQRQIVTFRQFEHKSYSVFRSLHREIRIGCLAVSMLTFANTESVSCQPDLHHGVVPQQEDVLLDAAEVTGSRVPLTFAETANKVSVITRQEIERAKVQSVNDLLKLCAGVDVRQRGGFGIQTDISTGGGTFDQISLLINGVSLNNPQTGHLAADFPVAIADIERIEIYDGASARTFGSQALNGAINIITVTDPNTNLLLHALSGSYATFGSGASLNLGTQKFHHRFSADLLRSDGATVNSQFDKQRAFYQGRYVTPDMKLSWQGGFSSQRYGANTFYSARYPNQWEANSRWIFSLKGISNGPLHLAPLISWVRSYDHFQLIHHSPIGENFHRNDVFTTGLTAYTEWTLGRTAFGGELRHEGILSSNLGRPLSPERFVKVENQDTIYYTHRDHRTNMSFFLEHNILLRQFTLQAGIMANRNTAIDDRFSFFPGIDLSYRCGKRLKIFASWNKSLRLPTFTDLYYKSPTQEGNVGLRQEKSSAFKLGSDFHLGAFRTSILGIYRHGRDMIDWVMRSPNDVYHSTNFKIDNYELQVQADCNFHKIFGSQFLFDNINVQYCYDYQQRHDHQLVFQSNYALDYLRHKLVVNLNHRIWNDLSASWYLRWHDRLGGWLDYGVNNQPQHHSYHPYALLSAKVSYTRPTWTLYGSFENLTSNHYYDLGAVRQPGFLFLIGANVKIGF